MAGKLDVVLHINAESNEEFNLLYNEIKDWCNENIETFPATDVIGRRVFFHFSTPTDKQHFVLRWA